MQGSHANIVKIKSGAELHDGRNHTGAAHSLPSEALPETCHHQQHHRFEE